MAATIAALEPEPGTPREMGNETPSGRPSAEIAVPGPHRADRRLGRSAGQE